jgi:hypothetical protein
MAPAEIADRSRQWFSARLDARLAPAGHDFAPAIDLKSMRSGNFFFAAGELNGIVGTLRTRWPETAAGIVRRAELACQHRFDLLGYPGLDYGRDIDWHLDIVHGKRAPRLPFHKVPYLNFDVVGDSKITWELNRHQHFVTLAKAWHLTGDERFVREIFAQFQHWRASNPYPMGINWASSLEVSIRCVSWTWTWCLLADSPLFSDTLRREWLTAIHLSARHVERYLSTYFSPNTHLLGECAALFMVGTQFPSLRSASRWAPTAWDTLWRSARQQVREDGFYFERSTYYHVYALDMLLHCRILAARNDVKIPADADELLTRMLNSLMLLGRAGQVHSMGDDDGGRWFDPSRNRAEHMIDPLALGTALFRRGDLKSAAPGFSEEALWLLGTRGLKDFDALHATEPSRESATLKETGIYLMSEPRDKIQLMIAAGSLGQGSAGHAHADLLSVQLIRRGQPLLADSGTLEYTLQSGERERLRGTAAHNTLTVDGNDQAETTGPFSWSSLPAAQVDQWITTDTFDFFDGGHNGYMRSPNPIKHRRLVFHPRGGFHFVLDRAEGCGVHNLRVRWHLAPSLLPTEQNPHVFASESQCFALISAQDNGWTRHDTSEAGSPVYGRRDTRAVVTFEHDGQTPAELATILMAGDGEIPEIGSLQRLPADRESRVTAYRYSTPQRDDQFFVCEAPGTWCAEGWESDASFVYSMTDHATNTQAVLFCGGSYVAHKEQRLLSVKHRVRYAWGSGAPGAIALLANEVED